jgi:hypothetical protein
VEQGRLSLDGLPRRLACPWRLAACGLALLVAGVAPSARAWSTGGLGPGAGRIHDPTVPVFRTERSPVSPPGVRLAEMWETENSVRYGSGVSVDESARMRREELDQEERSWRMLESLTIEPQVKKKPSGSKPPSSTPRKIHSQSLP